MRDVDFLALLVHRGHVTREQAETLLPDLQGGADLDGLLVRALGWSRPRVQRLRRTEAGLIPEIPGFKIGQRVGTGGTADVFRARERKTNRLLALKVLKPEATRNEATRKAFIAEARLLARLSHPGLVAGSGVARSGTTYFARMEYVEGATVLELLDQGHSFPEDEALRIVLAAAEVLRYLEEEGVVHRDVKPSNIMLAKDGRVVLIDLGFAAEGDERSGEGQAVGTVAYLSPEQARGGAAADSRSDIYSLGLSLFHVVVGRLPFESSDDREILRMQVMESLSSPELKSRGISPHLQYFIEKMVAKDADHRYQSWSELIDDVRAQLAGRDDLDFTRGTRPRPGRSGRAGTFAVLALLVAALGFAYYLGRRPSGLHGSPPISLPGDVASPSDPSYYDAFSRRPVPEPLGAPRADDPAPFEGKWTRLNDEAIELLGAGEMERAVEAFERCHDALPANDAFRRNLAEARARLARREHERGNPARAIESLGLALELAPEREDADRLRGLLARWRDEAELERDHWTEGSDVFELSYDTGRADILRNSQRVLDHLGLVYEDLRQWFGADPVRQLGRRPIKVVFYNRREFDRLTGLGDWAGGVFDGVVRVAVDDLEQTGKRWQPILTHELVHAFAYEVGGGSVPGWLNEGLAQYLEGPERPLEAARRRLAGHELFPLERLEGNLAGWSDPEAIARAYAQSLLLVDLIAGQYGEEVLRRMVAGCEEQRTPAESFEAWTSVPLRFVEEFLADGR